jgi:hypothetical protein
MKTVSTRISILLFVLFFAFGCRQTSEIQKTKTPTETTAKEPTKDPVPKTPEIPKVKKVEAPTSADLCGKPDFDLMANIDQSVVELSGTPYSRELKNDCSGMFHQVLDGVRKECPKSNMPTIDNARSSRSIAVWYDKNGGLEIIRDPANQGDLIQPGAVMFYGHGKLADSYNYETMNIETLAKQGTGINHVSIVTEVTRDENGVLQSYTMFHGRNVGKNAGETTSRRVYTNHPELPVYGNWAEPWLAVANVMAPPKK